jgi:diacylglycerol kinase family enzyme
MKSLAVVLNSRAGRAQAVPREEMIARIREAADWAELSIFDTADGVVEAARAACSSGAEAVAVAGGDGTAASVLDAARRSRCASIMVPLPLGTANMLPRRLYGDRDFETVLSEVPDYQTVTLHAGEAAGRTFYVALMAGAPVRFGQAREALRPADSGRRLSEAAKRLSQGISSLAGSRLRLELDGAKQKLSRSGAVLVAPGGFAALRGEIAPPGPPVLEHLLVRPGDPADLALKAASFVSGLPDPGEAAIMSDKPATLSGPRQIHLMLDGEVFKPDGPIEIRLIKDAALFAAPPGQDRS